MTASGNFPPLCEMGSEPPWLRMMCRPSRRGVPDCAELMLTWRSILQHGPLQLLQLVPLKWFSCFSSDLALLGNGMASPVCGQTLRRAVGTCLASLVDVQYQGMHIPSSATQMQRCSHGLTELSQYIMYSNLLCGRLYKKFLLVFYYLLTSYKERHFKAFAERRRLKVELSSLVLSW